MFSMNGPIYRVLMTLYKYLVLNLLYLVFCLPIVTIPAATAGLFAVARKIVYEGEPATFRVFWKGFRENWKQSTLVGLVILAVMYLVHVDLSVVQLWGGNSVLGIGLDAIMLVILSMLVHAFPLMVHVQSNIKQLFLNSLKLCLFKPWLTLVNLLALVALTLIAFHVPILFFTLFFSVAATLTYWLVNRKFKTIIADTEAQPSGAEAKSDANQVSEYTVPTPNDRY